MASSTPSAVAPHDERTDVKLAGDWLDRWLMELDQAELRAYLQLAHFYNTRTYHDRETLGRILSVPRVEDVLGRLEKRGLIEVIEREHQFHYHFPHRDREGFHRADPARPSLAEALSFQERMSQELLGLTEQDETPELRQQVFRKYPQLREEFELYQAAADPGAPRWRLWMEVSRLLLREFERTFGTLREDHGELFKEASSKVLQHHLDVVDGVVHEVVARLEEVFPEVADAWAIAAPEDEFLSLPFVRRLAQRYGIGAEQIYVNTLEALGNTGRVVVYTDDEGNLAEMILPSDTGLTKSEERVLFLRPEEREQADTPRNRERVRRARNKYANYLIGKGCQVLADFAAARRVQQIDGWLLRIAELVNESLSLLPTDDHGAQVRMEHVLDRFDAIRQGMDISDVIRALPAAPSGNGAGTRQPRPAKAAKAAAKPKAGKKPARKKKPAGGGKRR